MNEINSHRHLKESVLVAPNIEVLELIDELLGEGKIVRLRIRGRSMLPFLRDGLEQVDLSTPLDREITPGALVLFRYNGTFILHRLIRRKKNKLMIIGDNVYGSKEIIAIEQVIGIVRKIIYPSGKELRTDSIRWKILSICWLLIKPVCWLSRIIFRRVLKVIDIFRFFV
jgi:signal peptidase I